MVLGTALVWFFPLLSVIPLQQHNTAFLSFLLLRDIWMFAVGTMINNDEVARKILVYVFWSTYVYTSSVHTRKKENAGKLGFLTFILIRHG